MRHTECYMKKTHFSLLLTFFMVFKYSLDGTFLKIKKRIFGPRILHTPFLDIVIKKTVSCEDGVLNLSLGKYDEFPHVWRIELE